MVLQKGGAVMRGIMIGILVLAANRADIVSALMAQPKPPAPMRIAESKPVMVNEARFAVVAETEWKPGKPGQTVPIEIQLRITNDAKIDKVFHTFDTFGLKLTDSGGKQVRPTGGRNITRITKPFTLSAGASYSLCREAVLRLDAKAKAAELTYRDGTGSEWTFAPLPVGIYKLSMWYGVSSQVRPRLDDDGMTTRWAGNALTSDVAVRVMEP